MTGHLPLWTAFCAGRGVLEERKNAVPEGKFIRGVCWSCDLSEYIGFPTREREETINEIILGRKIDIHKVLQALWIQQSIDHYILTPIVQTLEDMTADTHSVGPHALVGHQPVTQPIIFQLSNPAIVSPTKLAKDTRSLPHDHLGVQVSRGNSNHDLLCKAWPKHLQALFKE